MVDEEGWGVPCWAWPASQPASQPAQRAGVLASNPHGDGVAHGRPIWEHFGSRRCADAPPPCAHQAKSCNAAACATTASTDVPAGTQIPKSCPFISPPGSSVVTFVT